MNNFDFLLNITPKAINTGIASRIRAIRKRRKLSQIALSEKAGVSLGSLKRFEQTGKISLTSLAKSAIVLELEQDMQKLFKEEPVVTMEDLYHGKD